MTSSRSRIYNRKNSVIILKEIAGLISKRKKIEKDFERLRKNLLDTKKTHVINSTNWEDWKMLSLEYDEIKQIMSEIDKRWIALRKIQKYLKK